MRKQNMRAIIIHRWDGNPNSDWYQWLKRELEKKEFVVEIPAMPNTSEPKIDAWISHLKKIVGTLDNETYFIAHSIGCQAVMRFLEKDDYSGKVTQVIFVAGWFKLGNLESEEVEAIANPWVNTAIDFNKIKRKISRLVVFLSSNEPYGHVGENARIFREKLDAKVTVLENRGHFTEEDGIRKLPELLKEIWNK